jgi:hypothetical protein
MKRLLLLAIQIALCSAAIAQRPGSPPSELKQFNFWIGSWNTKGEMRIGPNQDEWQKTSATNTIKWSFDGMVVEEQFRTPSFSGMSVSAFDPAAKVWRQTWVDNQGSYIALVGGWSKDRMILTTVANPKKPRIFKRMVFRDIKKDSFDWDWEASSDAGKTWKLMWHVRYDRAKS